MAVKIEPVTEPVALAEGPHWDEIEQKLYYVDIIGGAIHCYDTATGRDKSTKLAQNNETVGFVVPVQGEKNHFVIGTGPRFCLVEWNGEQDTAKIVQVLDHLKEVDIMINDGKADPTGRLYAGTLPADVESVEKVQVDRGSIYTIDKTGAKVAYKPVSLSNGLAWNLQKGKMYHADSKPNTVNVYDYEASTGALSNKQLLIDLNASDVGGIADGMTIDTDGNLWVACFLGGQIVKIDPIDGKVLQKVPLPAKQVTSLTFGGKDLDEIFVTTGNMERFGGDQLPPSGSILRVTGLGVRGYPGKSCKI